MLEKKKEGEGKNTYMNGDRRVGSWKNNMREGKGTLYFALGDKFEGAWQTTPCTVLE